MRCPSCDHDNRAERRFCAACGTALVIVCSACGASNEPGERFCGGCGAPIGARTPAPAHTPASAEAGAELPAGERRQLTVLFCDLVGSTPLSQQLDPEDYHDVVAQYQRAASAAVGRWGGHVAKEMGDGLLVYFGWPDAREDAAERAVRAGLAVLDDMAPVNARLAADGGTRLQLRIGMHTGPVVIADGGDVFGETPNIAARVQAAAEPDTVAITAATQRLVAGVFVVEDRGPQPLKGVREPMGLYRVLQPSGVRSRLDVAAGRLTSFVGRDLELGTLVDRWERAAEGEGQNVLVVGEAGVGKSRLVYQLRERLAAVPHTWLECSATPYTEGTPFHPLIELVRRGLTWTPEDTAAERLEKLERSLTLARLDLSEAVPLVAKFLGLTASDRYARLALHPDVQRRKTMELLVAWILAIAEGQPLVMLVEDLHWVDPSSLELLGRLMAQTATARVLLVGTARPDFTPPWPASSNLTTLQLARLTNRQAREMVLLLGAGALPAEMIDTLVARADGVPLYIEELTKSVAGPDVARGVDAIPATLADALMARLDRLSAAKEVAQRGAVLGREFPYALLAAVAGMDESGLQRGLVRLVEAEILFVRGEPPSAVYTFKHALVQEAAYAALLKRTRHQLHGCVVDVLCGQPDAEPAVIAKHAEAAGRDGQAIECYGRAGEQAQARSAHEDAIAEFARALAVLERQPAGPERDARELPLRLAQGASLMAVRGFAHGDTGATYERAVALATTSHDAGRFGLARIGFSIHLVTRGEVERTHTLVAEVLADGEATDDRTLRLIGHQNVAAAEHYQGKFASSLAHAESASALYDPARDAELTRVVGTDQGISALAYIAWNLWFLGRPDAALARWGDTVALARRAGHPFGLANAVWIESVLHWYRRDLATFRARAADMIAVSEPYGFPVWLLFGRMFDAGARVMQGDHAALSEIHQALSGAGETHARLGAGAPAIALFIALSQQAAGRVADAQATVDMALAVAAQTGQPYHDAELHRVRGELVLAAGGAADEAAARYQRALAIAREQGARSFELRAATSLARLWRDQGKRTAARELLAPVYGWFTEGFDTCDLLDAKALLEELR